MGPETWLSARGQASGSVYILALRNPTDILDQWQRESLSGIKKVLVVAGDFISTGSTLHATPDFPLSDAAVTVQFSYPISSPFGFDLV